MFTIQKIGRYFIGVGMYVLIFQFKFIWTNQTGPPTLASKMVSFQARNAQLAFLGLGESALVLESQF